MLTVVGIDDDSCAEIAIVMNVMCNCMIAIYHMYRNLFINSLENLIESDVEEIVNVFKQKSHRIAV